MTTIDLRDFDRIHCKGCKWSGEIQALKSGNQVRDEEDAPNYMDCPKCGENLAIRGWISFREIPEKAIVFRTGY